MEKNDINLFINRNGKVSARLVDHNLHKFIKNDTYTVALSTCSVETFINDGDMLLLQGQVYEKSNINKRGSFFIFVSTSYVCPSYIEETFNNVFKSFKKGQSRITIIEVDNMDKNKKIVGRKNIIKIETEDTKVKVDKLELTDED